MAPQTLLRCAVPFLLFVWMPFTHAARAGETASAREQLRQLTRRLDALERAGNTTADSVVAYTLPGRLPASPLEITGFGDILGGDDEFRTGQIEVDFESALDRGIVVSAALAFDGEAFGLGAFTVDMPVVDSQSVSAGVLVGVFDVPFGLDWRVYPSIDRQLISGPLAVEHIHDFWNDSGIQAYLRTTRFTTRLYAVNGFADAAREAAADVRMCLGGRQGFRPLADLEIGGSGAVFFAEDREVDMLQVGVDGQFVHSRLTMKGEYLVQRTGMAGDGAVTHTGFYLQGRIAVGQGFLLGRYGEFRPHAEHNLKRLSLGAGWVIEEGCEARLEQQITPNNDDTTLVQLAVAF